jgi:hypothetical protein
MILDMNSAEQARVRQQLVERFLDGDKEAAVELLWWHCLQGCEDVPPEVSMMLMDALNRYGSGRANSLDDALDLDKGNSARVTRERDSLRYRVHAYVQGATNFTSKTAAQEEAATFFRLSARKVRTFCDEVEHEKMSGKNISD